MEIGHDYDELLARHLAIFNSHFHWLRSVNPYEFGVSSDDDKLRLPLPSRRHSSINWRKGIKYIKIYMILRKLL
jgi:hypothetical protein